MTVKELADILSTVDKKERVVCMNAYSTEEINGYYYGKKDGKDAIIFTTLDVQPRIVKNAV